MTLPDRMVGQTQTTELKEPKPLINASQPFARAVSTPASKSCSRAPTTKIAIDNTTKLTALNRAS
jgi:hypothetical protein